MTDVLCNVCGARIFFCREHQIVAFQHIVTLSLMTSFCTHTKRNLYFFPMGKKYHFSSCLHNTGSSINNPKFDNFLWGGRYLLNLRSNTPPRATLLLLTGIYSCRSGGGSNSHTPLKQRRLLHTCITNFRFRDTISIVHPRPFMVFLFDSLHNKAGLAPLMTVYLDDLILHNMKPPSRMLNNIMKQGHIQSQPLSKS